MGRILTSTTGAEAIKLAVADDIQVAMSQYSAFSSHGEKQGSDPDELKALHGCCLELDLGTVEVN